MKILHIANNNSPTNMAFNEFYLPNKKEHGFLSLNDEKTKSKNNIYLFFRLFCKLLKEVNSYNIIHVHSHQILIIPWLVRVILCENTKIIYTVHTSYGNLKGKNKLLFRINFFLSNKIVFCSRSSFNSFPSKYKESRKSIIIRNGCKFDFTNIDNAKGNELVCLGRLNKLKRVDDVLTSYIKSAVPYRLTFIGDGPLKKKLESIIDNNIQKLDVEFTGLIPRSEVIKRLQNIKVIISYSSIEGMPISILEGISKGCIPILSDIPAHKELLDEGILCFLSKSVEDIIDNIKKVDDLSEDERIKIIRSNALVLEEKFSLTSMLKQYDTVYKEL